MCATYRKQLWLYMVSTVLVFCPLSGKATQLDTSLLEIICEDITVSVGDRSVVILDPLDVHGQTMADTIVVSYELSQDTFDCDDFAEGEATVDLIVGDICGNTDTCTALITFVDVPALRVECMDDVLINLGPGLCGRVIHYEWTIDDPCMDSVEIIQQDTSGLQSGDFFPIGRTDISYLFINAVGDTASCGFVVDILGHESSLVEIACTDMLHVSLNEFCEARITAGMILQGDDYRCYDDYQVTVMEMAGTGEPIPESPVVNSSYIGDTLLVMVCDPLTGNCCWGRISIEDKLIPPLDCPDITVDCGADISPEFLGFPEVEFGAICTDTTMSYEDSEFPLDCSDSIILRVERTWTVTKESGASSTCVQNIYVRKGDVDSIMIPPHYDDINLPSFGCMETTDWPIGEDGYRLPPLTTTGTVSSGCPNIFSSHEDHVLPLCGGSYKIIRQWKLFDQCTGEFAERPQIITVKNDGFLVFFDIDTLEIGTEPWMCAGRALLSLPTIENPCVLNGVYTYRSLDPDLDITIGTDVIQINEIPVGEQTIDIEVRDECGLRDTASIYVIVSDDDAPTAIGDQFTRVSLTNDGTAKVAAESLDDGSHDNCGIDSFAVRRLLPDDCDTGNADFRSFVRFCCADIGSEIMVVLRVYDLAGNYNEVMVSVTVEDKLPPFISCPPDITVACDFMIPDAALSDPLDPTFGRMVTDRDSVQNVVVLGHGHPDFADDYVWGEDGLALDNCGATVKLVSLKKIDCGRGTLERIFTATDPDGRTASCTQTITFEAFNPFGESQIIWPLDQTLFDVCVEDVQTDPEVSGMPIYSGDVCSDLLVSFEDEIFTGDPDACIKIFRTWKILDWCQFDSETGAGVFTDVQVIRISNSVPPTIFDAPDITVCNVMADDGGNLLRNGDFERGNLFFTSDFEYEELSIFEEGTYTVTTDAESVNANYRPCGDHTTGSTNYLVINGDPEVGKKFWCETIAVEEDIEYMYGAWITNVSPFSRAEFGMTIDGVLVTDSLQIVADPCEWVEYMGIWRAPSTATVELCIENFTTDLFRNEIGIDDIYFGSFRDIPDVEDCHALVELEIEGIDDCSDVTAISYELDLFQDGSIDVASSGSVATGEYPIGIHTIVWTARDGCGNTAERSQTFEVQDCQQPSPKCFSDITTVLMESTGTVEIWASDFDAGSDDLCSDHVQLSFSEDVFDINRTFSCDDLGRQEIEVWVTDEAGNQDFCRTTIIIQDNSDICDGLVGTIAGVVRTPDGRLMEDTQVELYRDASRLGETMTDDEGTYAFDNAGHRRDYQVSAFRNHDPANGLSTNDIVQIQKHILGVETFTDQWDYIAADVNNNESISALDIVDIRRLLLGTVSDFPENTSWRFADADQDWDDITSPWGWKEHLSLPAWDGTPESIANLIGVKIGDLTDDAVVDDALRASDRTGDGPLTLRVECQMSQSSEIELVLSTRDLSELLGMQMSLAWNPSQWEYLGRSESADGIVADHHIGAHAAHEGSLRMSWSDVASRAATETFVRLRFRSLTGAQKMTSEDLILSDLLAAEAYDQDDRILTPVLDWIRDKQADDDKILTAYPVPFVHATTVSYLSTEQQEVQLQIYHTGGELLYQQPWLVYKGKNDISITADDVQSAMGVLIYTILDEHGKETIARMIRVE